MAKPKKTEQELQRESAMQDIKHIDSTLQELMRNSLTQLNGVSRELEINGIHSQFSELIHRDAYNFANNKSGHQSTYNYLAGALLGNQHTNQTNSKAKNSKSKVNNVAYRNQLESLFSSNDAQIAALFVNQSSDIFHICDEIESICAYIYQLDEAVNILRDNILNNEQSMEDLPFEITFDTTDEKLPEYIKTAKDTFKNSGLMQKLNDHTVPNTIKFGRNYILTIPYSEIGVKLFTKDTNTTRNIFDYSGRGMGLTFESTGEIQDESYTTCLESINMAIDNIPDDDCGSFGKKDKVKEIIEYNLKRIQVDESETPPIIGLNETTVQSFMKSESKFENIIKDAIASNNKKFKVTDPASKSSKDNRDKHFTDATIDIEEINNIHGSYKKLVDPRQMVPIRIFDHILGYYYFENYDYARVGNTITDLLTNNMNFNDQNQFIDTVVGTILRKLTYGDLLEGDNDFKSMVLNCIMYAEKRNNPVRIKFVPAEYVVEFKTNCDADGNGQPVLMRSLVYGRLYVSLLLFFVTATLTKSIDSEFYYLKEGLLSESFEDQVADIIEQFRTSNVDISQIINGNLMHSNRAINKRYFVCTGTQDTRPFDLDVVSGQNINIPEDFLNGLKKASIAASGVPSVAVDLIDEPEFATMLKMSHSKVLVRCNTIQTDINPSIAQLIINLMRFDKPNAIPDEILRTCKVTLKKNNTINNNISSEELNNVNATVDAMIEVYFGGGNTEVPVSTEYIKEEMKKQLVVKLSPSLPWGLMDTIYDDCLVKGKLKEKKQELTSTEDSGE